MNQVGHQSTLIINKKFSEPENEHNLFAEVKLDPQRGIENNMPSKKVNLIKIRRQINTKITKNWQKFPFFRINQT